MTLMPSHESFLIANCLINFYYNWRNNNLENIRKERAVEKKWRITKIRAKVIGNNRFREISKMRWKFITKLVMIAEQIYPLALFIIIQIFAFTLVSLQFDLAFNNWNNLLRFFC